MQRAGGIPARIWPLTAVDAFVRWWRRPLSRMILSLALPVTLSMLTTTAIMVSDTRMVGPLGRDALAIAGVGGTAFWTLLSFFFGAAMGIQVVVARRYGEHRFADAGHVLFTGVVIAIGTGALATVFGWVVAPDVMHVLSEGKSFGEPAVPFARYRFAGLVAHVLMLVIRAFFDGIGHTRVGLYASIVTMVANIGLNYVLIYGAPGIPALGANGAAIASSIAGVIGLLVLLGFAMRRKYRPFFHRWSLDWSVTTEIVRIGFAPALEALTVNLSFITFYGMAARIDTVAVAASQIIVTILSISFMPGYGFSVAAATAVGQALGRGQQRLARAAAWRAGHIAAVVMGLLGLVFILSARELADQFSDDPEVIAATVAPLILVALLQVGDAYNMVWSGALRSGGLVYPVLCVFLFCSFGVLLPCAYLAGVYFEGGLTGLWSGIAAWLITQAAFFYVMMRRPEWTSRRI